MQMSSEASRLAASIGGVEERVSSETKMLHAEKAHLDKRHKQLQSLKVTLVRVCFVAMLDEPCWMKPMPHMLVYDIICFNPKVIAVHQVEIDERRKSLQEEEKALYRRYKGVSKKLEAENKAARAEVDKTRKVLARERGELASKIRNTAAEAEEAAQKVWGCSVS